MPVGRLVDPSLRGRKGERKGHADARVPSSFPPPPGAEGRGHARGRVRQQRQARATGPPAPRVPPRERGTAWPPCDAPGPSPAPRLSPAPRPGPRARARGGEAEEGAAPRGREAPPGAPPPSPSRASAPPHGGRRRPLDRPRTGAGAEDTPPPAHGEAGPAEGKERVCVFLAPQLASARLYLRLPIFPALRSWSASSLWTSVFSVVCWIQLTRVPIIKSSEKLQAGC